ncbi:FAD-dependent monooxygenase [Pigmentiphaga soli]|uniref:FAD-dependent monooxygenase n=1 Tax=Pigmentiphaga soli TaxID=1007095 RepID=A0ABP8GWG6_9BURK
MPEQTNPILIAGGGIGGLSAALALLRRNIGVVVLEQAAELREVGAGVQISPNGSRALNDLGILDDVRSTSCKTERKEIRLWNTGQTWTPFDLGDRAVKRYGFPYFTAYRVDLHNALIAAVRALAPDAIRLNSRCAAVAQHAGGVTVTLADGRSVDGRALIGADGIHSAVRTAVFGTEQATYANMIAWRAVIPMERVPARLRHPVGTNWVGPGGHVIHYPLRRGELLNFVGYLEGKPWAAESWTTQATTAECARDFEGWHEDVHALIEAADAPFKWGMVRRPRLQAWTEGRITLLGDACHAMFPFLAQGAVMAMEDGVVIARCIAAGSGDIAGALQRYESARRDRCYAVVDGSAENVARFHNRVLADPVEGPRYVEAEWASGKVQARYDWIFEYDPATVDIGAAPGTAGS